MSTKPTMEHRHYKIIAAAIADLPELVMASRQALAEHFAKALKGTNPNYNAERFIAAAMGKPINGRDRA